MHMDRHIHFLGVHGHLLQRLIGHGVGRVRGEGGGDQGIAMKLVMHLDALVQVFVGVLRPYRGKVDDDHAHHGAHAGMAGGTCCGIGEEIHIVEAGGTAAQHLGHGELGAVMDELLADPAPFRRPDVPVQPLHQWQVVGQTTHQGHGGMRMGIDETGDQGMARQFQFGFCPVLASRLDTGQQGQYPTVINDDAVMFQHQIVRFDRDDPAGVEEGVDALHGQKIQGGTGAYKP